MNKTELVEKVAKYDLNTRTVIGSTIKTLTAVIIMRVVEEAEISLMDTLDREFTL